jgi:hypothetical protein
VWTFTVPVAGTTLFGFHSTMYDSAPGRFYNGGVVGSTSTVYVAESVNLAAADQYVGVSATVPFTWATSDYIYVRGWYFAS